MSTERKPGSRGVTKVSSPGLAKSEPRFGAEPEARGKENAKGSTKTASPKRSFKKRPRK